MIVCISLGLSITATRRAENNAQLIEVAARQRMLVNRYLAEVLLVRAHAAASPSVTAQLLTSTASVLLDGGTVHEVLGDDDEQTIAAAGDPLTRRQLEQERRLVVDLVSCGRQLIATSRCDVEPSGGERLTASDPLERLREIAALASNVGLDATTTLTADSDANVLGLIRLQVELGGLALLSALSMGALIVVATRRQAAHFRSLVQSSDDLVLVLDAAGRPLYVSPSVSRLVGETEHELLAGRLTAHIHPDDRPLLHTGPQARTRVHVRCADASGAWRHLEASVTDLRKDRHVRGVVFSCRDVTDRIAVERQLAHAAFHDSLTGLANRAMLLDRVDQALSRYQDEQVPFAVLLLDLDNFKQVNDSLGHPVGDDLLVVAASRLTELVRPGDTVARLGGDEFCLLLEGASTHTARTAAARITRVLSAPVPIDGQQLFVSASIGIASPGPGGASRSDLLRMADLAMYSAKRAGPGRLAEYRPEMEEDGRLPLTQEAELRAAIEQGEFLLHYQPEHDIRSGHVVGVEALVRWDSPSLGLLGPSEFIPVAEASTAIRPLGELVVRTACRHAAAWARDGVLPEEFVVWVNVSQRQLTDDDLVDTVVAVLAETGLAPARLGVEVTETALVAGEAGEDRVRRNLERLHGLGLNIATDHFGPGFSSLAHLRSLPVDVIKIDRSFVAGVHHLPKDAAIVGNVINLAHALGLRAVAEGVETEEQLDVVRGMGCDVVQGYLLGRPCPHDEMTELLGRVTAGVRL